MKELKQAEVQRLLCYNPLSGNFRWRIALSNRIKIGSTAGCIRRNYKYDTRLYWCIRVYGRLYLAHRLAFLYMRGHWPSEIDHKDGNGLNNRWLNLRECTHSQNKANQGPRNDNKLGIKGVYRNKNGKYVAQIYIHGKKIHLGYFDTSKVAATIYQQATKKYFGEFAST